MRIYLDHHATTPVDPRVLDAMLPYLKERFGNASSKTHPFGWEALEAVEEARKEVAALLGARPKEIVFTSGATESNNLALFGAAATRAAGKNHVVTQATEHHAVLEPLKVLSRRGIEVTMLRPDSEGRIDPDDLRRAIKPETFLVSIMAAQNEIGTLQPLAELGAVCRERGVLFHTDAAQAAGKVPIDVDACGIDLLSLSGHKFYAPKGVGALFVRRSGGRRVRLEPLVYGGGQEGGLRAGTLNVPGIVALGAASRIAREEMAAEAARIGALRDLLLEEVESRLDGIRLNGPPPGPRRLAGNLSLSFSGVDGTALLLELQDIAASSGSACTTGAAEPSYVLKAIGLSDELATSTLRLGLGRFNTEEEIRYAARRIVEVVTKLRRVAARS